MLSSNISHRPFALPVLAVLAFWLCTLHPASLDAAAKFGGAAHGSVHGADIGSHDVNVDHNVNVVNVNHGCCFDDWGHPIATAAVVTAAAVTVGAVVASLPSGGSGCSATNVNGTTYQVCDGVYYQPVYQGDDVSYQVVDQP